MTKLPLFCFKNGINASSRAYNFTLRCRRSRTQPPLAVHLENSRFAARQPGTYMLSRGCSRTQPPLAVFFLIFAGLLCLFLPALSADGINIIFIVPDGLSPGVWSSVRYASVGVFGRTNLDNMPCNAYYSSYAADSWINDSAGSISAMMTGEKIKRGVLNQDSSAIHGKKHGLLLQTSMEYAAEIGYATGIITNTEIYEATPAGAYAHHHNRKEYANIAAQMVEGNFTPNLIFAGGRKYMRNTDYIDPEENSTGMRDDGRDLVVELIERGYKYIESQKDFDEWNPVKKQKILGLFAYEDLKLEIERSSDKFGEPGLWELTDKALKYLDNTGKNFFLLVEAGRIDHVAHANEKIPLIMECIAFDKTVGLAQHFVALHPNTLLIIAADHATGGGCAIGIEKEPDLIEAYGWGKRFDDNNHDAFPDNIGDLQSIAFGWSSSPAFFINRYHLNDEKYAKGQHTAEDCMMFACGWGAAAVDGYMDNTDVYHLIKLALPSTKPYTGVIVKLNGSIAESPIPDRGEAVFYYHSQIEGDLEIQVFNLMSKKTSLINKHFDANIQEKIIWKAEKSQLPALYRYSWSFNGQYQGRGTFGLK